MRVTLWFALLRSEDRNGELTARMNVEELMEALGVKDADLSPSESEFKVQGNTVSTNHIYTVCVSADDKHILTLTHHIKHFTHPSVYGTARAGSLYTCM